MSGHSKWATIKHKKGAKDAKRGALFTKLAKDITIAASEGGGDPGMNFSLRLAVDKAKAANMPKDNIERSIKKGTGELGGESLVRVAYEAYGPAGSGIIIDCTTDNTNRTAAEIRNIIEGAGGKWAEMGSVSWQFEQKGLVVVSPMRRVKAEKFGQEDSFVPVEKDVVVLELMEIDGVEDVRENEDGTIELITSKTDFKAVNDVINAKNFKIETSELVKIAKDTTSIPEEDMRKIEDFVERLEDHDDVDNVWTNIE